MPYYNYACLDCEQKALKKLKRELTPLEYEELVLFETRHAIEPSKEELLDATICPRCNGNNCAKSLYDNNVIGYIRGNGFLDTAGAKRDMNLFHLTREDPYAEYRQPGEVEEMKNKLRNGGKHDPKTKYFTNSKVI